MTINDIHLEEETRRILRQVQLIDHLTREGMAGSLEDCFTMIEIAARDARRRLRQICESR